LQNYGWRISVSSSVYLKILPINKHEGTFIRAGVASCAILRKKAYVNALKPGSSKQRSQKRTIVVPTITVQEEQDILRVTGRNTVIGKRNYAMVLLALRTGLRSVDIANLKLLDIKWNWYNIEIVQVKTGRPLTSRC